MDLHKLPVAVSLRFIAVLITLTVVWEKIFPKKLTGL